MSASTPECVDRAGAVTADGAVNTAHWLRQSAGRTHGDAWALATRATRLRACPEVAAVWSDGRLSSGQIDVIVASVKDRTAAILTDHAADLASTLVGLSMGDTGKAMRHWARQADALVDGPAPIDNARTVHLSRRFDGRGELSGRLDPAGFKVVSTALDAATTVDGDGERGGRRARRVGPRMVPGSSGVANAVMHVIPPDT